ncbi:MAG TPA: glycosyltransferase [Kiritimatiellia bacterium]|nr:glycosyltransferase [Kiritimatiellia bacterium]HRZ10835.1 glycosyltransferase [Kiritimatiellia bacterium]HSA18892.1 glycosyltransferase [Kiritimatiellia bacterium]
MRLSVIIPTRDRPDRARRLIEALSAQPEAPEAEWILVDDGSAESAARILADLASELAARGWNARRLRHETARGVSAARNAGARAAAGDILLFIDDDILPEAGSLACCRRLHAQHPEVLVLNGRLRPLRRDYYARYWQHYYAAAFCRPGAGPLYTVDRISSGFLSVKRRLLDLARPLFDETLTSREDFDLWLRLRDLGIPAYKADELAAGIETRTTLRRFLDQRLWYARGERQLRRKHGAEKVAAEEARLVAPNRLAFLPLQLLSRLWLRLHGFGRDA